MNSAKLSLIFATVYISTGLLTTGTSQQIDDSMDVHFLLLLNDSMLDLTNRTYQYVDPKLKTIILIYGWLTSLMTDQYVINVANEYQRQNKYNVIYIDWSLASYYDYIREVLFVVQNVGTKLGALIMSLQAVGVDVKNMHLVGFSLGAHMCGIASRYVRAHHPLNQTVQRITGLDPAGPLFSSVFGVFRNPYSLSARDAEIVDVTHTNGDLFGFVDRLGTIDFYVNGGSRQPSCGMIDQWNWLNSAYIVSGCSHMFAVVLYEFAVNNSNYRASSDPKQCQDVVVYGDEFDGKATGIYYIQTNISSPFKTVC